MKNTDLKQTYDTMHKTGKSAWFDDGQEERKAILEMGQPWKGKSVLEIGCGEGDLLNMIHEAGALFCSGMDYSHEALIKASEKYPKLVFTLADVHGYDYSADVLVMQGVMEHLDDPFAELADMIERFKPKTVITSMPGFLNTRGIIWHTLDMLGAVMSKTDLHFIDPWEVKEFCDHNGYRLKNSTIDHSWASGAKMIKDLRQRIPLALRDGGIPVDEQALDRFMDWLQYFDLGYCQRLTDLSGALNIYRIEL